MPEENSSGEASPATPGPASTPVSSTAPESAPAPSPTPSPPPVATLNFAEDPELDRNPEETGKSLKSVPGQRVQAGLPFSDTTVVEQPYSDEIAKDVTRQTITLWLIGLLCVIVGLTFVALFARGASSGFRDQEFFKELKQVLDVLVGPVITLLASAIGFYFGYKQGALADQATGKKP